MDNQDLEREKGITITSKLTSLYYNNHTINILDTPATTLSVTTDKYLSYIPGSRIRFVEISDPLTSFLTSILIREPLCAFPATTFRTSLLRKYTCKLLL